VLAPENALLTLGGTSRVFVVVGDHVEERVVKVGQRIDGLVEIADGLKSGERVATSGVNQLVDGMKVR
jgi:membrane fusion protein (multidrug efflux system)